MARVCGVCRKAPREDDPMGAMRLLPEDAPELEAHGVYHACADCIVRYGPRIHARLVAAGVLKVDDPLTPQYLL